MFDFIIMVIGGGIYASSVVVFMTPNNITPGGITGIAAMLHYLINTPIGIAVIILNLPLFMLGLKYIGREFMIKTIIATIALSVSFEALYFLPKFTQDRLLAAIFGGVVGGIGLGIVVARGATTGGSDLAGRLINHFKPHISMGTLLFIIDAAVVLSSAIIFRDANSALYAMITLFISGKIVDSILGGISSSKMTIIISENSKQIKENILDTLKRGVTVMNAAGGYTNARKDLLICVVRPNELIKVKHIVKSVDPKAFMIFSDASEVMGEGFK